MFAFDFETSRIQSGLPCPPPVCLSYQREGGRPFIVGSDNGMGHMDRALLLMLESGEPIVGFNVAFDLGVWITWFPQHLTRVFSAIQEGRFLDASIAERLREMSRGLPDRHHSLSSLCELVGLGPLDKKDSPRLDYARLLGLPLSAYPESYKAYSLRDAVAHLEAFKRTWESAKSRVTWEAIATETRHSFWLHLVSCFGFRTDTANIEQLRASAMLAVDQLRSDVIGYGFIRSGSHTKDMKAIRAAVVTAYGGRPPLSKSGKSIATDKISLQDSGDPLLQNFSRYGEWSAVLNKDVKMLEAGTRWPVHTRFGLADGTRTTSSGPNTQNFRRIKGIRECVIPRDGFCFGQIDVAGLEMGTQAQNHIWEFGDRRLADLLNSGVDLHLLAACSLMGWDYDDSKVALKDGSKKVKEARQFCKIANFGYPGFMAAKTLVPYARGQGVTIDLRRAEALKANWGRVLPGCLTALQWAKKDLNPRTGKYDSLVPGTENILRAGATLSACANMRFQGLGARAMKSCGWEITKEMWTDPKSVLKNSRIGFFIHDEFIVEIPIGEQDRVMRRMDKIIVKSLAKTLPDVAMKTEFCAMTHWSKDAVTSFNNEGELQIWGEL